MLNEAVVCCWKWHLCVRGMFLLLCPLYAQFLLLLFWTIFKFELLSQGGTDRRRIFVIRNSSNSKLLCLWRCSLCLKISWHWTAQRAQNNCHHIFPGRKKTFVKQESAKTLLRNGINPRKICLIDRLLFAKFRKQGLLLKGERILQNNLHFSRDWARMIRMIRFKFAD